ncbi:Sfi1 spindle body protein [Rhizoctonia solani]|uniref:Sfi1 spindle body protein n=1 Tax=Rhizoctonia solani TaxID=456999 RepID=A0A8H7LKV7_9AGAM|nr:Sfi1 spindle body protein [Rhizoctonia solani]
MLIISNPASGHKNGPQFIENYILPLLNKYHVSFKLETTNAPKHAGELAKDYLQSLSNAKNATILVSGGDGTIHEVINALYGRLGSRDSNHVWPKLQLILVNSGTANALYHSIYPTEASSDILHFVRETLPTADAEVANGLQSVVAYLRRTGSTRPLALARTVIRAQDGSERKSLLSIVVASTALHANLLHTSEELRAAIPGVERYTEAAKQNIHKWSHATVRFKPPLSGKPILLFDPASDEFVETATKELSIDGPFAYFLSTVNVDRLESGFVITPLASKIKPDADVMDIVVIQPLNSPQVSGDTEEERAKFAQILMGSMGAARSATHTHLRYNREKNSSEGPSESADGPLVVQYYRCGGWEWMPLEGSSDASYICVDGTILEIGNGEWAQSECITDLLPADHGTFTVGLSQTLSKPLPTRTSSPLIRPRSGSIPASTPAAKQQIRAPPQDISASSTRSLQQITPEDVQVIDAIIERAPATAKAFVNVYKAYNAVLQERGLDPSADVTYYEFLLKIGLLKGAEWGDKWASAKAQLNLGSDSLMLDQDATLPPPSPPAPPLAALPSSLRQTPAPSTRLDRTPRYRARFADEATPAPAPNRAPTATPSVETPSETPSVSLQRLLRKLTAVDNSSTTGRTETSSVATPSSRVSNLAAARIARAPLEDQTTPKPIIRQPVRVAGSSDDSTPTRPIPSYRSRFTTPVTPAPPLGKVPPAISRIKREQSVEPVRAAEERTPRRRGSEPDTWRIIKMEKDADHFRNDRLLEKFFALWRQNAQWIRDTSNQISEARRKLALRENFTIWLDKARVRADMTRRAARVDAYFTQRRVLLYWRQVSEKHRRQQWQSAMKKRLRTVKSAVDQRILRQAWQRWRQTRESTYALEQADGFHDAKILHKCIVRWAERLQQLRTLPIRALEFRAARNRAIVQGVFETWKNRAELRVMERMFVDKRDHRIKGAMLVKWKSRAQLHKTARKFHNKSLLRHVFVTWKNKTKRVSLIERRANNYLQRQDNILLRAVTRVWAAKARGEQLARINRAQLVRDALGVWRNRLTGVQSLEGKAVLAIQNAQKELLGRAFYVMRDQVRSHKESELLATRHYQKQLLSSAFKEWRESTTLLRKQARQARIARRFFAERAAFGTWKVALTQKRLSKLEDQLKRERLRGVFQVWRDQVKRQMTLRRVGDVVQRTVEQRVKYGALKKWIGSVVENKLQLLQAMDERNTRLQRLAFEKWRVSLQRHQEDMSLLRSFQDVQREDMLRRAFQRWLAVTRHQRLRRQRLEQKEQQLRFEALGRAWDIWRDKFKEETLRGTESAVRLQAQRSLVFSAFRLWESKSRALPALRFYSESVRRRAFEKWKASLPSAKLARVAREFDREHVLRKMLVHWKERYQTRIGLKAVARARYLRLPPATAAPRPSVLGSAAASRAGPSSRPGLPSSSSTPAPLVFPRPSAISLLARKATSERAASSVPPETRAPSPSPAARARSSSPVKPIAAPKPIPVAVSTPAQSARSSLLSGFRVTPRPTRAGTAPNALLPTSISGGEVDSDSDSEDADVPRPLKPLASSPVIEAPVSRLVGRRRFAR